MGEEINMGFDTKDCINFDFQGWPEIKMSVRKILTALGVKLNEKTNMLEIPNDDKILDAYPTRVIDDGMGYGVDDEKIIAISVFEAEGEKKVIMFTEKELPNIVYWLEDHAQPALQVDYHGKEYFIKDLKYHEDEHIFKYELCPDLFNDNIVDNIFVTREEIRKIMGN